MQINGELTGWVPSFYDKPEYNGEPTDFRLKVQVADAQDLVDAISKGGGAELRASMNADTQKAVRSIRNKING